MEIEGSSRGENSGSRGKSNNEFLVYRLAMRKREEYQKNSSNLRVVEHNMKCNKQRKL